MLDSWENHLQSKFTGTAPGQFMEKWGKCNVCEWWGLPMVSLLVSLEIGGRNWSRISLRKDRMVQEWHTRSRLSLWLAPFLCNSYSGGRTPKPPVTCPQLPRSAAVAAEPFLNFTDFSGTPSQRRAEWPFKKRYFIFLYLDSNFPRQHKNSGLLQALFHSDFFVQMPVTEEPTESCCTAPSAAASQPFIHRKVFRLLQTT